MLTLRLQFAVTWKHVVLVFIGAIVAVVGAVQKDSQAVTIVAMGIITGALGHAGSGGRSSGGDSRLSPAPPHHHDGEPRG